MPAHNLAHSGLPTWFRALCLEASRGGSSSYEWVGFKLACSLEAEIPYDLSPDEWIEEINELTRCLDADNVAAWAWLEAHLPKFAALVPERRRTSLVAGMIRARSEDRL